MAQQNNQSQDTRLTFDELSSVQTDKAVQQARRRAELRQQRRERQAAQRQEHMLDAAFELFQETGVQGFNMRELGHRAGYTPGALYAYFDGKADILQALRHRLLRQLALELHRAVPRRRSGARDRAVASGEIVNPVESAATAFLPLCELWWHWMAQDPLRLRLLLAVDQPVAASPNRRPADAGLPAEEASNETSLLEQLRSATAPCGEALQAAGLPPEQADQLHEATLVWGFGLLVLHARQTHRPALLERFLDGVRQRLLVALSTPGAAATDVAQRPQGDLFGR